MKANSKERGQALVLIVFAMLGLFGITALAIDGGMAYSDRRNAQNAADSAALAAALSVVRNHPNWSAVAANVAQNNGYNNNGSTNTVAVANPPGVGCNGRTWQPSVGDGDLDPDHYVQVVIHTMLPTYFAAVIGIRHTYNCVESVAKALPPVNGSPFPGDAIVGLDPNGDSFLAQSNATYWKIKGGGIFANHNAIDKHSNVTFLDDHCATAVGAATGFTCESSSSNPTLLIHYPEDIAKVLPRIPTCNGASYTGADGLIYPQANKDGSVVSGFDHKFAPGLYCVDDAGGNIHDTVTGTGVTFYVRDTSFTMKYNGGGSFAVQAPTDPNNEYAGVLMFSNITTTPCSQNVEFRGNGSSPVVGTIFMPSACINWLGNSEGNLSRSQLIGYRIYSNGDGAVALNYNAADNYQANLPGEVQLIK
jgi:Flp pilus assembly protein TadG